MAQINGNKYIGGGSSGVYLEELFDSTTPTITKGQHSTTGTKVNVAGKGILSIVGYINKYDPTLTLIIDGITFSGTIEDLANILGSGDPYGTQSRSRIVVPFQTSAVVTLTSANSSITTYVAM